MRKIEGFAEGERAWSAWCCVKDGYPASAAIANATIQEVVVMLPEIGLLRRDGGEPYLIAFSETLHKSPQGAREWCASQIRTAAGRLAQQAADLAEPRVVSV